MEHLKLYEEQKHTIYEIQKAIGVGIIVILVLAFFYLITYFAVEKGAFGKKYTPLPVNDAVITYDEAFIGIVFNRPDEEYYVVFDNFGGKDNNKYLNTILSSYATKEEKLPVYKVDMTQEINKKYLSDTSNKKAYNDAELQITTPTLIKVKNNMNALYLDDIEQIKEELS